jgi:hypothetical protein
MHLLLLLLLRRQTCLLLCQSPPNSPCLFWSEIEGKVLLVLIVDSELRALVGVDDCEDTGDGFADVVAVEDDLLIFFLPTGFIGFPRRTGVVTGAIYILVSLEEAPPVIFWVRRWPSSVLRSRSCFLRSSLPLDHKAPALTFDVD